MVLINAIAERVSAAPQLVLVGIGGHGAAGKTTLAKTVPGAVIVSTDEFWNGSGFALDRVKTEVLDPLRAGMVANFRSWNWAMKASNGTRHIEPGGVVIVEGVCALHEMLRDSYDLKVWVETPRALRLERAVQRDGESERDQWINVWMPNEDAYVDRDQPLRCVDLIVSGVSPTKPSAE